MRHEKRAEIPDGSVKGLMLRVGPRGRPTWTLRYTIAGGGGTTARGKDLAGRKFFRVSLGEYPELSIKDARARASTFLAKAARGQDPIAELEERATTRKGTVSELVQDFMDGHVRGRLRSAKSAEWVMNHFVLPRFKDAIPEKIKRADIVAFLDDLARTAKPTAAIDTRKWLSIMFAWAVEKGRLETSPVTGVKPPIKAKSRERVLSIEEARAVWKAAGDEPYPSGTLVRLLMLTGARLREIGHARVSWLDRRLACLDIPGEAYKTGDPTVIPLIPVAMEIIEQIKLPADAIFLISSNGGKRPVWTVTPEALARIRTRAEKELGRSVEHWTLHDLRRTVATHLARLGVDEIVIERVLGHRIGGVKGVYNRYRYVEEKRAALMRWTAELIEIDQNKDS